MRRINFALVVIILLASTIYGQVEAVTNHSGEQLIREEERRSTRNDQYLARTAAHVPKKDFVKNEKRLLTPDRHDITQNAAFLRLSKTGIAKIFPDVKCSRTLLEAQDTKCVLANQMTGQGAYYSFRKKSNIAISWSDIYFAGDKLRLVAGPSSLGLIEKLGDWPIESVEVTSAYLSGLTRYNLPQTVSELETRKKNLVPEPVIEPNMTYGLRFINWARQDNSAEDKDILIVLRVIRKNEDGSITFLWRELQRKRTSKLGN